MTEALADPYSFQAALNTSDPIDWDKPLRDTKAAGAQQSAAPLLHFPPALARFAVRIARTAEQTGLNIGTKGVIHDIVDVLLPHLPTLPADVTISLCGILRNANMKADLEKIAKALCVDGEKGAVDGTCVSGGLVAALLAGNIEAGEMALLKQGAVPLAAILA